jgi:hypothetical protein
MAQRLRGQLQCVLAAMARASDEPRPFKHSDVLADPCERYRKGLGNVGNTCWAKCEPFHDRPARRIRNGRADAIDVGVRSIMNHLVQYSLWPAVPVKWVIDREKHAKMHGGAPDGIKLRTLILAANRFRLAEPMGAVDGGAAYIRCCCAMMLDA